MTAAEVIEEIKRLPKEEQCKVLDFARRMTEHRRLSPDELGDVARRLAETKDHWRKTARMACKPFHWAQQNCA